MRYQIDRVGLTYYCLFWLCIEAHEWLWQYHYPYHTKMSLNLKRKPRDKPAVYNRCEAAENHQRHSSNFSSFPWMHFSPKSHTLWLVDSLFFYWFSSYCDTDWNCREFSAFEGGDSSIADEVRREIAIANGEVIEVDSDDDDDEVGPSVTCKHILDLCQQLEVGCMQYGYPQFSLDLSSQLQKFRANLRREELLSAKQSSLEQFFPV